MANYILGFGGNCCDSCTPDNACKAKPVISSSSTASGTACTAFSYTITASNTPTSYSYTGSMPPGLSLNTSTGVISGTPTAAGSYSLTGKATNACGDGTLALTITIAALACTFSIEVVGSTAVDNTYSVACQFDTSHSLSLTYQAGVGPPDHTQLKVYAGTTLIWDSGCISGNATGTVSVPLGTSSLEFVVTLACGGFPTSEPSWRYTARCV